MLLGVATRPVIHSGGGAEDTEVLVCGRGSLTGVRLSSEDGSETLTTV